MAESQGLDPRHDPIYQRGYDPTVHGDDGSPVDPAPSRRARSRRSADEELFAPPRSGAHPGYQTASRGSGAAPAAPERVPAPERIPAPEWLSAGGGSESDAVASMRPDDDVVVVGASAPAGDRPAGRSADRSVASPQVAPWRNPYLVGLVVGGVVLALVGFQMFRAALETIYVDFAESGLIYGGNGSSDVDADPVGDLVSMQVGWSLGPLLFIVGIAAILAVLVFIAVRWRPAPRPPAEVAAEAAAPTSP